MLQLGGFLGPLFKTGLPLIKIVIKPLAKSVFIPLGLTAAASVADEGIHKKILESGRPLDLASRATTLIIFNNEMEDLKIVKSLEHSGLLLVEVTETVQNEIREQKSGFLSMLLGILGAILLGNILSGKQAIATSQGRVINKKGSGINRAGECVIRAVYGQTLSSASQNNKTEF